MLNRKRQAQGFLNYIDFDLMRNFESVPTEILNDIQIIQICELVPIMLKFVKGCAIIDNWFLEGLKKRTYINMPNVEKLTNCDRMLSLYYILNVHSIQGLINE